MDSQHTRIADVILLTPRRFGDDRGFFSESWNKQQFEQETGLSIDFVQDNHSVSHRAGTIRGLHFQTPPFAQDKLIRCGRGALLDVAVDIRVGSPSYGHWVSEVLSFENGRQLLVPKGFLHGFATLEDDTEIIYKCSDYYDAASDRAVRFNDPDLAIDWQIDPKIAILSDKDRQATAWAQFQSPFLWKDATV